MPRDKNARGKDRAEEARESARERGADAYGPGGNPNPDDDEVLVDEDGEPVDEANQPGVVETDDPEHNANN